MEWQQRIVLADPPNIQSNWVIANHPNLGVLYLISYLRQRDPGLELHYLDMHLDLAEHLEALDRIQPDLYGLSFSAMRENDAFLTISAIKQRFPSLPLICGGPYPTVMAEHVLSTLPVDVCVKGEGELTLAELIRAFRDQKPFDAIPGIAFKHDGRVVETCKRPLVADIDSLPFPAWDLVDFKKYRGTYQFLARPNTSIITSRGCPFNCVFCANPVLKLSRPWLRMRSPTNVCDEIALLYRLGIREVSIRSDEFNPVLAWPLEFCKEIQKRGFRGLYLQGNVRADNLTNDLAREMKRANFWLVQLGIESGNQRTLDGIRKKLTLEQISEGCRILKRHGIKVYGYVMLYHAWEEDGNFCCETPEDVDRTLAFLRELRAQRLLDYMSCSTATPMIGSELYDIAKRHQRLKPGKSIDDLAAFAMTLPGISEKDMKRSRRKALQLQLSMNLRSGHNNLADWPKNWHKIITLAASLGNGMRHDDEPAVGTSASQRRD
jgi:radical SAM superfamily enzyme YgiQ (UPF0313 family)